VKFFYPPAETIMPEIKTLDSQFLSITPGEQKNFRFNPSETRDYVFSTFGNSDTVMVLFEEDDNELRYVKGDDDSGEDRNSQFVIRLIKNKKYILRIRLYYKRATGDTAVMIW